MKIVNFFGVLAIVSSLIACGGSKTENTDSTEALGATFEMLDEAASQTEQVLDDASAETSYDEEEPASDDGEDWDALLDSYEEYVDSYISLLKKASDGDLSAMSEYTDYLNKAEEFGKKLENSTDEMSVSQVARLNKITQKMLQAVQDM